MPPLPTTVATPRLLLRWWAEPDAPALVAAVTANVDHLRPWMPWVAFEPLSVERRIELVREWRAEAESGGDAVYGVFLGGRAIGGCGLHRRRGPTTLEIGYWIDVRHVSRGFATEVARALTDTAFGQPHIDAVEIRHDRANTASRRVPERLGFTLFLERRRDPQAPGECGIECGWRIDRSAWFRSG